MGRYLFQLKRKRDGSPVFLVLDGFTPGEKADAERLEKAILAFKPDDEHQDMRAQITQQAFELILAAVERRGPELNVPARQYLEGIVAEVGFPELWAALKGAMGLGS